MSRVLSIAVGGGCGLVQDVERRRIDDQVRSTSDGGPRSLRAAVDKANSRAGADTIVLQRGKTYQLTRCGADDSREDANHNGDLDYAQPALLAMHGRGAKIRNRCAGERVLHVIDAKVIAE